MESNEVDTMEVERHLDGIEVETIKSITNIEELIHYLLEFFSRTLFAKEKFEKLLTIFTIT